jgi:ferritin-like metal-binding protein YciE
MSMKMESMQDLLVHELRDLYNAEQQIVKALPKMAKAATSDELKSAFTEHLEQTEVQIERLEQVFEKLDMAAKGKKCKAVEGLIEEGKEIISEKSDPAVKDAALIAAAQRVEHYEIAGYGCARTYARLLGQEDIAELLQQTLDEEGETDKKLTQIAESSINVEAVHAGE